MDLLFTALAFFPLCLQWKDMLVHIPNSADRKRAKKRSALMSREEVSAEGKYSRGNLWTSSLSRKTGLVLRPSRSFFLSSPIRAPSPLLSLLVWPQLFPMTTHLWSAVTVSTELYNINWPIPASHLLNDPNRPGCFTKYQSNYGKHQSPEQPRQH